MVKKITNVNIPFILYFFYSLGVASLYSLTGNAQPGWNLKENSVWPILRPDSALDFKSGSPPSKVKINLLSDGNAYAAVSDAQGQLLFYTNGGGVLNRNHKLMPNGSGLPVVTFTEGQGNVITPVLNNPNQYYLFSNDADAIFEGGPVILYYSVIDMTLDGGLGDIIPGQKMIPIDSMLGAPLAAVPGNNCDLWLMAHDLSDTVFKAYHITAAGIDLNPVVSSIGFLYGTAEFIPFFKGMMAFSPQRNKVAITSYPYFGTCSVQLYDFDPNSGLVTNMLVLDTFNTDVFSELFMSSKLFRTFGGVCFSPDGTKLYAAYGLNSTDYFGPQGPYVSFGHNIEQFDLSLGSNVAILASKTDVFQSVLLYEHLNRPMRLGPDGKIYFPSAVSIENIHLLDSSVVIYVAPDSIPRMGVISEPNQQARACKASFDVFRIFSYAPLGGNPLPATMGTDYVKPLPGDTIYKLHNVALCSYQDSLILDPFYSAFYYEWSDGSTEKKKNINTPGIYWVKSGDYCHNRVDTFSVVAVDVNFNFGGDTIICNESTQMLNTGIVGAQYVWQDSSRYQNYLADTSGIYWVEVTKQGCIQSDTINLVLKDLRQNIGEDIDLCKGDPVDVSLKVKAPAGGSVLWSTGSKQDNIRVTEMGQYWVEVTNEPCTFTDSIRISIDPYCECIVNIPSAFSPNRDGRNDLFLPIVDPKCPVNNYTLSIYNRYGQRIFYTKNIAIGWDGMQNGKESEIGNYFYELNLEGGTTRKLHSRKGDITLVR